METHHHGHVHHEKKWKDYLFEFLMLFLAVTAGFFMENLRERYVEKERAHELVASLETDLRKDTALLNWLDEFRIAKRKPALDSFYLLLNKPPQEVDARSYYDLAFKIREWYAFRSSSGTINQLENAGYLRYFSDDRLIDDMSEYEFRIQDFKNDENIEYHLQYDKLLDLLRQNLNADRQYDLFLQHKLPSGKGVNPIPPDQLKQLKSVLIEVMWYNQNHMIMQNERLRKNAIDLIHYLQKKYS